MSAVETIKPQRILALEYANEIRCAKATIKRDTRSLTRSQSVDAVVSWITDPQEVTGAMTVAEALGVVRGLGQRGIHNMCWRSRCQPDRRLRDLYTHQRVLLADAVRRLS